MDKNLFFQLWVDHDLEIVVSLNKHKDVSKESSYRCIRNFYTHTRTDPDDPPGYDDWIGPSDVLDYRKIY